MSVAGRPGTIVYKFQVKIRRRREHSQVITCPTALDLTSLLQNDSGAVTCPTAPESASLLGRTSVLPHAPWLWIPHPCSGGLRCCYVSYGFRPCLPARGGSDVVTCLVTLRGSWGLRIKKCLAAIEYSKTRVFSRHIRALLRHM
jgi:hypothetical protein